MIFFKNLHVRLNRKLAPHSEELWAVSVKTHHSKSALCVEWFTFQSLYSRCIASCARPRTCRDTTEKQESLDFTGTHTTSLGVSDRNLIAIGNTLPQV